MVNYTREKRSHLLKAYLFSILVVSALNLAQITRGAVPVKPKPDLVLTLSAGLSFLIFLFSVYCGWKFFKQKLSRLTLVLPLANIVVSLSALGTGIILGLFAGVGTYDPTLFLQSGALFFFSSIIEGSQILFSAYLLYFFWK